MNRLEQIQSHNNCKLAFRDSAHFKMYRELIETRIAHKIYLRNLYQFNKTQIEFHSDDKNFLRKLNFFQLELLRTEHNLLSSLISFTNSSVIFEDYQFDSEVYCFSLQLRNYLTHFSILPLISQASYPDSSFIDFIESGKIKSYILNRKKNTSNKKLKSLKKALSYLDKLPEGKIDLKILNSIISEDVKSLFEKGIIKFINNNKESLSTLFTECNKIKSNAKELGFNEVLIPERHLRYLHFLINRYS